MKGSCLRGSQKKQHRNPNPNLMGGGGRKLVDGGGGTYGGDGRLVGGSGSKRQGKSWCGSGVILMGKELETLRD